MKNLLPKRHDLFHPFEEAFNSICDNFFSSNTLSSVKSRAAYPKMDVYIDKSQWIVEVALPGLKPSDINIEILPGTDPVLKVSGCMNESHQTKEVDYHIKELRRSSFERFLSLPHYITGDPETEMIDGILRLKWQIQEEKPPISKKITIK